MIVRTKKKAVRFTILLEIVAATIVELVSYYMQYIDAMERALLCVYESV